MLLKPNAYRGFKPDGLNKQASNLLRFLSSSRVSFLVSCSQTCGADVRIDLRGHQTLVTQ